MGKSERCGRAVTPGSGACETKPISRVRQSRAEGFVCETKPISGRRHGQDGLATGTPCGVTTNKAAVRNKANSDRGLRGDTHPTAPNEANLRITEGESPRCPVVWYGFRLSWEWHDGGVRCTGYPSAHAWGIWSFVFRSWFGFAGFRLRRLGGIAAWGRVGGGLGGVDVCAEEID